MKLTKQRRQIADMFHDFEATYPAKSTEWLIAMTCSQYSVDHGVEINNADVCEALIAAGKAKDRQAARSPQ